MNQVNEIWHFVRKKPDQLLFYTAQTSKHSDFIGKYKYHEQYLFVRKPSGLKSAKKDEKGYYGTITVTKNSFFFFLRIYFTINNI